MVQFQGFLFLVRSELDRVQDCHRPHADEVSECRPWDEVIPSHSRSPEASGMEIQVHISKGGIMRVSRRMESKPATSRAARPICFTAILISFFSFPLRAQTSGGLETHSFNLIPSSSVCGPSADQCSSDSNAIGQNGSAQNDAGGDGRLRHDWVHSWIRTVDEARASQPHFVSPIVATHVMLVEQYRYDMSWQQDPSGGTEPSNYGGSRGLEIIPTTRLEVGIFPPAHLVHQSKTPDGFGDLSWQVKFRAFSATEGKGDYFVGFFLGGSFGTGTTLLGRMILFNTAVDYRIKGKIWPMIEQNSTFWSGGTLDGKKEVFMTPGLVLGSFPLAERLHLSIGGGVQIAATQFHRYNHRWILSVRFPF